MHTLINSAEKVKLESQVLSNLVNSRQVVSFACDPKTDFWMQIKTPSSVIPANMAYLQYFRRMSPKKLTATSPAYTGEEMNAMLKDLELNTGAELIQPVVIHPSAIIHPSAKLGPNVKSISKIKLLLGLYWRKKLHW